MLFAMPPRWPSEDIYLLLMSIIALLLIIGNIFGLVFYTLGWQKANKKLKERAIKLFLLGSSMWLAPIIIGLMRYIFEIITGTTASQNLMFEALLLGMVISIFFTMGPGLVFYFLAIASSIFGLILYIISWMRKNEKIRGYAIKLFLLGSVMLLILIVLIIIFLITVQILGLEPYSWMDTGN